MSDELKPCPFPDCKGTPKLEPTNPKEEGSAWGQITCEHHEFTSELNGGSIRYLTQFSIHCDEDPIEKVIAAWNNRTPDPSLTRILKLAAAYWDYDECLKMPLISDNFIVTKHKKGLVLNTVKAALTPEDHALLKEISL